MKKRRLKLILFVFALLLAVLGGFSWFVLRSDWPAEPMYKDKPLSYWLREISNPNGKYNELPDPERYDAFKYIGTNAIPFLLRWLQAKDSPLKLKLATAVEHLPWIHFQYWSAEDRNSAAGRAFRLLKAEAKGAVPELIQIYERQISEESQEATAQALGSIGRAAAMAIPMLLSGASNAPTRVRASSVQALGQIHEAPELVVPGLIKSLSDADLYVRVEAIEALEKYRKAAQSAVPDLVKALSDKNETINACAESALKTIDPEALEKARKEGKVRKR